MFGENSEISSIISFEHVKREKSRYIHILSHMYHLSERCNMHQFEVFRYMQDTVTVIHFFLPFGLNLWGKPHELKTESYGHHKNHMYGKNCLRYQCYSLSILETICFRCIQDTIIFIFCIYCNGIHFFTKKIVCFISNCWEKNNFLTLRLIMMREIRSSKKFWPSNRKMIRKVINFPWLSYIDTLRWLLNLNVFFQ